MHFYQFRNCVNFPPKANRQQAGQKTMGGRAMPVVAKVLVVGGGIGGLAVAVGLKRHGIDVEIVELMQSSKVYHVGIIVQGNFLHALGRLGLAEKAIAAGFPHGGYHNFDVNNNHLFSPPPIQMGDGGFPASLGMTRPALHEIQLQAVREMNIPMHLGITWKEIEVRGAGVRVTFTNGRIDDYDLVVGADGWNSDLRRLLFGQENAPEFTGQGVWRYNIPRPNELRDMSLFRGKPGGTAGLVPITKDSMYVFYVCNEPGNPKFPPETLDAELRKRLEGYKGPIEKVREQITDANQVVYRPLWAGLSPAPWHKGRVVLLGDAVHASTPHLGQGAALAVEDAVVLSEELDTAGSVEGALTNYVRRRFERCRQVVEGSRAIGDHEMNPDDGLDVSTLFDRVSQTLAQPL